MEAKMQTASFPFSNHPLSTNTQSRNWNAVMALAEQDLDHEVIDSLRQTLTCAWDADNGRYVSFDPWNNVCNAAAGQANLDLMFASYDYEGKSNSVADHRASENLRHRLLKGLIPEYELFFNQIGISPVEILRHYDLVVSKFDKANTIAKIGTYGAILNTSVHRRLFISGDHSGLKYLALCYFPGLQSGLYSDIGYTLERIAINVLIDEKDIYKFTLTKIIVDAVNKSGFDLRATLLDALQGHPEKLYGALESEYGLVGLGYLLLVGGSDFFPDETSSSITRYIVCYDHTIEYFEQFGYSLNEYGI